VPNTFTKAVKHEGFARIIVAVWLVWLCDCVCQVSKMNKKTHKWKCV
jgi:hypothetical protein